MMISPDTASRVADYLLQINAVKLSPTKPFTWSSGWLSPIYCDNRLTLSYPEIRTFLRDEISKKIEERFKGVTAIVGVATAGIALGALVADHMGLPFAYCRPKPKEHGMKNQLEGRIDDGARIVVIEDLISTGGSSLKVVNYLREQGHEVLGLAAVFSYGFAQAAANFKEESCDYVILSDYTALINCALRNHYVDESQMSSLNAWRSNPASWKPMVE
jgi:orotate phosphoribosyltransferase